MKAKRSALSSSWRVMGRPCGARIHLERCALHDLGRHQTGCSNRHDLIVVAMDDEGPHIEFFEILGIIDLGEFADTVVLTLMPPIIPCRQNESRTPLESLAPL
jgi:hypothetical protein